MNKDKKQSCRFLLLAGLSAATSLSFGMSTARGELLFSDSFSYPVGPINGQGPPPGAPLGQTGWSLVSGNPQVLPGGLRFRGVASAIGAASLLGSTSDYAVAGLTPVTSGVVWLGYLIEEKKGSTFGFAVVNLGNDLVAGPGFGVIYNTHVFGIDNDTGQVGSVALTTVAPSSMPTWLVVKLDFDAGIESLYINPTSGNATPDAELMMAPDFQATGFDQVFLHAGSNNGHWVFDEVRVGATFANVQRNR